MTVTRDERRIAPAPMFEIRQAETNASLSMLSGLAVPYNVRTNIGWFEEEFAPGSLSKSTREAARGLPLLVFHDALSLPIGVAKEWKEESIGLRGVWKLEQDARSQAAARMAVPDEDGFAALGYMSIRFQPIRSEWTYASDHQGPEVLDHCVRTEARLMETSLVSTPAYQSAAVEWVRSSDRALRAEARGAELAGYEAWIERARAGSLA